MAERPGDGSVPASVHIRPTLRTERRLLRETGEPLLVGMDEVGRGALGGPVTVGAVLIGPGTGSAPVGLRDSKLLTPAARVRLTPRLRRWPIAWAVGHASAAEIDTVGIIGALRLAGRRALAQLPATPLLVLLDGNHDWLTRPRQEVLPWPDVPACPPVPERLRVVTRIKADAHCASVAAASVLAKTARDAIMGDLAVGFPDYGWEENKGYASPGHLQALTRIGPCVQHRRTWHVQAYGDMAHAVPAAGDGPDA